MRRYNDYVAKGALKSYILAVSLCLVSIETSESGFIDARSSYDVQVSRAKGELVKHFNRHWNLDSDPVGCHRNIRNFVKSLLVSDWQGRKSDLIVHVVYAPKTREFPLQNARFPFAGTVGFHTFLTFKNEFAFDFGFNQHPSAPSYSSYLEKMYGEQNLCDRELSVSEFLSLGNDWFRRLIRSGGMCRKTLGV